MGPIDSVRGQLIEIIEWTDDTRTMISFRFPDRDGAIRRGAQLIVRESQVAQFVYLGQFGDTFGPGRYTLATATIPVLTAMKGWKYGFESPFKADVYFVTTRLFTGNTWGTSNPVMVRDADLGVVRLRAFGTYDFHVVNVPRFLKEVAGTDDHFAIDDFTSAMRSRIVSLFSTALATSHLPVVDAATRYRELGDALLPLINPVLNEKYGLELSSFIVENVSAPPEVEQAIDRRGAMTAIGDLNSYIKYQMAEGLAGGGSRIASLGPEMAAGLGVAQQLLHDAAAGGSAAPATAGTAAGTPDVLTPADVAALLKVGESDVIASLEAGTLRGTRVGSQWRVTRLAVEQFLK